MQSRRYLALAAVILLIFATFARLTGDNEYAISLAPVPYEMKVPKEIADRVTVQDLTNENQQAVSDGAIAVVGLSYQPIDGEKTWFMTAYYFDEDSLDKTIIPDEVPPYGTKLFGKNGMALSVQGPQESGFELQSQDGKNFAKLYEILYAAKSYKFNG